MLSIATPPEFPLRGVKAVLFDAYGTLFDVYSVALLAEQRRTNRLLQTVLWAGAGCVAGALVVRLFTLWHG